MKSLSHLNKFLLNYKWLLLLGMLFIIISNFFAVISPELIRVSFDSVFDTFGKMEKGTLTGEEATQLIIRVALFNAGMFMLYALLKGVFLFFMRQTIIVMSRHIEYDQKNEIFHKYQQLSLSFYRKNNTGDLMNRISEDVSRVRMYLGPGIMYTANLVVLFVMILIQMFRINPELSVYVLIPLPLMGILVYVVSVRINKQSEEVQNQQSTLTTHAQEAFSGIRVLKTYGKEEEFAADFKKESEEYKKRVLRMIKTDALFHPIIALLIGLSTVLTVFMGGLFVVEGKISIGTIPEFLFYVNMLTWPFASVGWVTSLVQRAAASQERINEFLHTDTEIKNHNPVPHEITGEIEFRNVNFTYPDSGIVALKNVNVTVNAGETLAIIGKTGSGKSTMAALINRLYDPTSGEILLDGQPLQKANLDSLRSNTGYVPQEVFLFSDTISNNIAFGLKEGERNQELIEQAARDAAIYGNIMEFKERFETVVGERGITLSGGQKQRISIARAIIRNPKILVFDDCLSAVDTETEDEILRNLKRIMKGRTSVIISHRVSSVKHANKIIVLHHGQVVEEGTHQQLLDKKGFYFDIYRKQLLEDEKITQKNIA